MNVTTNQVVNRIKRELKRQLDYKGYSDGTFSITEPAEKYGPTYSLEYFATDWLDLIYTFDDVPRKEWMSKEELSNIEARILKWVKKIQAHKNDWLEL